jgi:PAS domain S-box-containing protein
MVDMDKRQLTVLIVGGAPEDRAALRETLIRDQAARYSVIEAETGTRALELCRARKLDCLILDECLPDLSVVEALKRLTDKDGSSARAVIALVSRGAARLAVEAMKSGAHDCLEKHRAKGGELRRAVSHAIEKAGRREVKPQEGETIENNSALGAGLAAFERGVAERGWGKEARRDASVGVGAERPPVSQPEIADTKRAEEQLRLLKTAIEQGAESVIITTAQLDQPGPQIVYVNSAFTKMTGHTSEDVIGKTPRILQGPKTDRGVLDRLRKDCEEGRVFFGGMVNYRKDGSEFYLEWIVAPVRNERGEVTHFIATQRDVTERQRAEEALRQSEERLRSLIEQASDGIFMADVEGTYTDVNSNACQMLGYTREELIGKKITDLLSPEDFPRLDALRESLLKGSTDLGEWWLRRKDGHYLLAEVSTKIFPDGRWHAIVRDITERKRTEEILRESEARFRQLADAMPQIVFTCAPDGPVDYFNQRWRDYVDAVEEIVGYGWMETVHPDDRERTWGKVVKAADTGQPFENEQRVRGKDGQYRWHLLRVIPFRDGRGRVVRWIGTMTDIHDRKLAEAEREEMLTREQTAREVAEAASRSKDEFLEVVSHELRTPLNAMLGYARLLRYGPLDPRKVEQAVEIIERNGKAQSQLIADLLDTAGIITGKLKLDVGPVNLVAVIQGAIQTIYPAADAKGVSIQADLKPEVGQITGDPVRLQQVVWNLLSNAVKFTSAGGRVEVRLERIDPHVCVIVSDTGKGISPDFLPYVFDRFRQADASRVRRHGGLGLGLSLVKYLVELHGGTIEATSAGEDQGSTFKVLLPVRAVSSPLGEDEGAPVAVSSLEETIMLMGVRAMVVDDETDARELVESVLEQYGADVVAASSAAEAYELITAAPTRERPDVMVADLGMPDEDGFSLLRRVREWEHERGLYIPAVALTAYGRTEDRVRALRAGFQTHVAKPVEPAELAVVITSLVRRPEKGEKT